MFTDPEATKIRDYALVKGITWKFIPPASPWWGWLVRKIDRLCKTNLKESIRKSFVEF